MSKPPFILILFLFVALSAFPIRFSDEFTEKTCRVDFYLSGNAASTSVFLSKVKEEPFWGGRQSHTDSCLNLGDYRFRVLDSLSSRLLYSDGFSALFHEWQSTPEAQHVNKSFEQTIIFPFPRKAVTLIIEKRLDLDKWQELFRCNISPNDRLIQKNSLKNIPFRRITYHGSPQKCIDIAVVAEGYSTNEMEKFYDDARKLSENLLTHQPFTKFSNRINIYAIGVPSEDSGVSMPQDSVWKNTAVGSHFFTFYEPRYLTTENLFRLHDWASVVPYDAIYVLANTPVYGGGGIYNSFALTAAGNPLVTQVTVHEFGHSFAGLADEYFYDQDVLDNTYDLKREPWEPNITSLVHFDRKWKSQLPAGTPIPTPVNDSTKKSIGVFEGGGYLKKGMYRPFYDCRMRTNNAPEFCPVCQQAVEKMILFLTDSK